MLEKILLVSLTLISLFHGVKLNEVNSNEVDLFYLETDKSVDVENHKNFALCVHMKESLKKDDIFYLLMASKDEKAKMNNTLNYKFLKNSCENFKTVDGNPGYYDKYIDKTENKINEDIFYYEYKITKLNDDDKYMIVLIREFTGNKMTIQYSYILPATLIIILVVCIVGGVVIIVVVIIIICCCVRRKKVAAVQQQYQSSFVNEPIVPQE